MEKISQHISYKEATFSQTATRKDIDNTPNEEILERMRVVAENVFEPLRAYVGGPIKINSFYRSIMLNTAIGVIGVGGLILARFPIESKQERDDHYKQKTADQMIAVDNDLMREQHSSMPIHNERQSRVTFGAKGGSE